MKYDDKFYEYNLKSSGGSAKKVMPFILDIIKPDSLVDFGCGRGTWLDAANNYGVENVIGLDGDWNKNKQINKNIDFYDLKEHKKIENLNIGMAMSLEVFEHLEMNFCNELLDTMMKVSDVVVFASAFVNQGGTDHINEQYPSFWAKKFIENNYNVYDVFRRNFWGDSEVDYCYQQNMYLYVKNTISHKYPELDDFKIDNLNFMDAMHPEIYLKRSGRDAFLDFSKTVKRIIKNKFINLK